MVCGMPNTAVYPGSFDPLTNGHLDVIERAASLFDELVIAIAHQTEKNPLFSVKERVAMVKKSVETLPNVRVTDFESLLVDYAHSIGAKVVVRGLRAVSDFEFEFQMALMNRTLAPDVETIFLMPKDSYSYLSSRIIKQIASLGGEIQSFVPAHIEKALLKKLSR
jgi:pantetheine-phosphate adenylyltransferase